MVTITTEEKSLFYAELDKKKYIHYSKQYFELLSVQQQKFI